MAQKWSRQEVIEKLESLGDSATKQQMVEKVSVDGQNEGIDYSKVIDDLLSYSIYVNAPDV